ncbi:tRNA-specific adenosine deaminase, partial [Klebsiella pneumoniae]|nr:tRNA-specific adenosine deaminase [Klebsiella pneumoniae]
MYYTLEEKDVFMREALREAEIALEHDEIPIGCVIVKDG